MKYSWSQTVFPIAALFSFRMLGLFLLIPVFTLYASQLKGATPALMGIALGGYGLSQGILQMPFGFFSDKWGRKPIITLGLILFALGSLVGALSHTIYGIIIARILQGTGAVGSVLIALLADLTPDNDRTKAMAVIGMTIGMSFSLAMVISPALSNHYGLAGIFYLTACLAIAGLILLHFVVPTPAKESFHRDSEANPALFKSVLTDGHLLRLNLGIFCQHFILTSTFFVIPLILNKHIATGYLYQPWHFYLSIMVLAFIAMVPFIIYGEKRNKIKLVYLASILITAMAQCLLTLTHQLWLGLWLFMFFYFVAFNILEALLPSQISKQAHPSSKGTAMGVYSTSQFLGIFAGGACSGFLYQWHSNEGIFLANTLISLFWFFISLSLQHNHALINLIVPYHHELEDDELLVNQLMQLTGIKEAHLAKEEAVIYLRLDRNLYLHGSAEALIKEFTNKTTVSISQA